MAKHEPAKESAHEAPKELVSSPAVAVESQPELTVATPVPSPIPKVAKKTADTILNPAQPMDHEYTHGIYIKNSGEAKGEEFALCVTAPDQYENTHFLKNSEHFWSGREVDFKLNFDKP